jgi:hypothetical protein
LATLALALAPEAVMGVAEALRREEVPGQQPEVQEVREEVAELQSQWTLVECSCSGDTEQPKLRRRQ